MGRIADMRGRHPLAMGMLTGTAVGACLGVLFAPRRGSETRRRVGEEVNHLVGSTSSGYRRAKGSVGHLASRCHHAYAGTRDRFVQGAKGTSQYVREVADAVTRKTHRQGDMDLRRMSSASSPGVLGQPRKAI
jgi:gas vesicle protein